MRRLQRGAIGLGLPTCHLYPYSLHQPHPQKRIRQLCLCLRDNTHTLQSNPCRRESEKGSSTRGQRKCHRGTSLHDLSSFIQYGGGLHLLCRRPHSDRHHRDPSTGPRGRAPQSTLVKRPCLSCCNLHMKREKTEREALQKL